MAKLVFLSFLLIACTETQFSSSLVVRKAQTIVPPLKEWIQLQIQLVETGKKQNKLIKEFNEIRNFRNGLVMQSHRSALRAYKREAEGKDSYEALQSRRDLQSRMDRADEEKDRINGRIKPLKRDIEALKPQAEALALKVNTLIEEARNLNQDLPAEFIKALDLIQSLRGLKERDKDILEAYGKAMAEHSKTGGKMNSLIEKNSGIYSLYRSDSMIEELEDNFRQLKRLDSKREKFLKRRWKEPHCVFIGSWTKSPWRSLPKPGMLSSRSPALHTAGASSR